MKATWSKRERYATSWATSLRSAVSVLDSCPEKCLIRTFRLFPPPPPLPFEGDNRLALHYHQCELSLSEAVGDRLGAAVAHRRVGECECELGNYGAALGHQQEHLRIAEELGDQAEVQRALTTLGRTYLHQADREHGEETDQLLLKAGTAFLKSLDVCDKLAGGIPER